MKIANMQFNMQNLPEHIIKEMKDKNIWTPECPVKLSDLRIVEVMHYDFALQIKQGYVMVHEKLAPNIVHIFNQLLDIKFPIHSIKLINEFDGNDHHSMEANNSSCFNFRNIPNSDLISMHSYGLAIDINPVQNPYILESEDGEIILPKGSEEFLNRKNKRPGMIEEVAHIFMENGFSDWGGNWNKADYHHFQFPRKDLIHL